MHTFTGVVLAGGASRRMGQDKANLNIGTNTLLDHTIKLLQQVGASKIVILGRGDGPNAVADKHPHQGPAVALVDFLTGQPKDSRHLVVPVDMPGLSVKILSVLARQSRWAYFANYPLPCMAIANLSPSQFSRKVRDLHLKINATLLPVPASTHHCFTNINTPRDYSEFRDRQQSPRLAMNVDSGAPLSH